MPTSVDSLPTALLRPGEADRVLAGHPWIYAGSVLRFTAPVVDGAIVQIKDHRQRFLGIGCFNSRSKIQIRWLAAERSEGVAYSLNLGLDVAYLSSGLTAVLASQLGAEHPERWIAGGLSVSLQALFLVGIDVAGLLQSSRLQKRLLHDLVPAVSFTGAFAEPSVRLTLAGRL